MFFKDTYCLAVLRIDNSHIYLILIIFNKLNLLLNIIPVYFFS